MFTGLVKEIGTITKITKNAEGIRFEVEAPRLISEIEVDDSVSVDGACQTVVEKGQNYFTIQSVKMTLDKTIFGHYQIGDGVNLELAMRANDRLGGHFVTGHVNEIGTVLEINKIGQNSEMILEVPKTSFKYLIPEGSITINGVSLTVAEVIAPNKFKISLIPHTLMQTNLSQLRIKSHVNVEYDVLIKFVENLLFSRKSHNLPLNLQSFAKQFEDGISIQ